MMTRPYLAAGLVGVTAAVLLFAQVPVAPQEPAPPPESKTTRTALWEHGPEHDVPAIAQKHLGYKLACGRLTAAGKTEYFVEVKVNLPFGDDRTTRFSTADAASLLAYHEQTKVIKASDAKVLDSYRTLWACKPLHADGLTPLESFPTVQIQVSKSSWVDGYGLHLVYSDNTIGYSWLSDAFFDALQLCQKDVEALKAAKRVIELK